MTNGLTRGVPVQDLPENQDPSVRYTVNEQTGEVVPWDVPETGVEKPKRRARKWADVKKDVEPAVVEESGDPGVDAPVELAATSVRELGS